MRFATGHLCLFAALSLLVGFARIANGGIVPVSAYREVYGSEAKPNSVKSKNFGDFSESISNTYNSVRQSSKILPDSVECDLVGSSAPISDGLSNFYLDFDIESEQVFRLKGQVSANAATWEFGQASASLRLTAAEAPFAVLLDIAHENFGLTDVNRVFRLKPGRYTLSASGRGTYGGGSVQFSFFPTPEPSTLVLATMAGLGLVAVRSRGLRSGARRTQ